MKVLVLGSAGQIGKPTCEFLKSKGHQVIEFDIQNSPYEDLRENGYLLEKALGDCDFVYYLASDVGGAKYLKEKQDSYEFISDNMKMMTVVFGALKRHKKPFIFTSSQMAELSFSTYGNLKLLGEKMARGIGGLVVRLWNVYGPETDELKSHVITDFCKNAKNKGEINMMTTGEESRQFLYAEDCAECFLTLTEKYATLDKTKNYHITTFEWITILEIAECVAEISGAKVTPGTKKDETQIDAMNPPDPYILEHWKPKTPIQAGIKQIFDNV